MTGPATRQQRTRRRTVLHAVLRPMITTAGILAAYFAAPLDQALTVRIAVTLCGGLLVLAARIAWQVRLIVRSDHPRLRAVEALAISIPLFLVMFAAAYVALENATPDSFTEPLTKVDGLYFTITVFATVGFGDITARTELARILVMMQMITDLVIVGLVARILLDAVRRGLDNRSGE